MTIFGDILFVLVLRNLQGYLPLTMNVNKSHPAAGVLAEGVFDYNTHFTYIYHLLLAYFLTLPLP